MVEPETNQFILATDVDTFWLWLWRNFPIIADVASKAPAIARSVCNRSETREN